MNKISGESFQNLLLTCRDKAISSLKLMLNTDDMVCTYFESVAGLLDHNLLRMLVNAFVKSKQKQLLRKQQLAPSKASISLRANLRTTATGNSTAPSKPADVSCLKAALKDNCSIQLKSACIALEHCSLEATLSNLTVKDLKNILKLFGMRVTGTKAVCLSSLSAEIRKWQKDKENKAPDV